MEKKILDWKKYGETARKAAAEGAVLLENNGALPIRKGECVSIFGRAQCSYYKSGTGSGGLVNVPYVVSIPDAFRKYGKEDGILYNEALLHLYESWVAEHPFDLGNGWGQEPWSQEEMPLTEAQVQAAAQNSDAAVIVIGRTAGEDQDAKNEPGSYLLSEREEDMLAKVCAAFSRTIVVLNVGSILDMSWVKRYAPSAVLYTWHGGMEGGGAVYDVLSGRVNPCGRLSDTIAVRIEDYPSHRNFGDADVNVYEEDIYVGYRYFETAAREKVLYPFGFGLSYTTFSMETVEFILKNGEETETDPQKADAVLQVTVKNTGKTAGKEVVQVYAAAPQGRLGKPAVVLAGFAKTGLLHPGEAQTVSVRFPVSQLASYDDAGVTGNRSCYVLEAGRYEIRVGSSSRDAVPAGSFVLEENVVTERLQEALAPVRAFSKMHWNEETQQMEKEPAALRQCDLSGRILENRPSEDVCSKNLGYRLQDVEEGKVRLSRFLNQLTDEELACLTNGEGMCSPKVTAGTASAFGGVTEALLKYGIPIACCADGPSGIRMDCGTTAFSLPNGTCQACTFDLELIEELYEYEGMELRSNKIDTLLGPGINIHRHPLNGRNFEYFSEDPLLTGKMAAAQLRGMHKYDVTGTIKHFAANNQEFRRNFADSVVSERAVREIYLKGFEIAVKEGNARSIMTSYNPLNGIWCAGNYDLNTTILRREWGYTGIVMTDWWAKTNEDGEPEGDRGQTAYMVRAQNDLYMVVTDASQGPNNDSIAKGLKDGTVTRGELLRSAENICGFLLQSPAYFRLKGTDTLEIEEKNVPESADRNAGDLVFIDAVPGEVLDIPTLKPDRGESFQIGLKMKTQKELKLSFWLKSDAGELAQIPISLFLNNSLTESVSVNGTSGEWKRCECQFGSFMNPIAYMKLYFGQGGIELKDFMLDEV